jgi:hypothetical protein
MPSHSRGCKLSIASTMAGSFPSARSTFGITRGAVGYDGGLREVNDTWQMHGCTK